MNLENESENSGTGASIFCAKKITYKLKKGTIEYEPNMYMPFFFMCLDSLDLPLEEILENYNFSYDCELVEELKRLGY